MKEEGRSPFDAAIVAARELGGPILAMTIVLIAVYVPIGFQGGLTGALFTEFAFSLAGSVAVSGVIALTLSPMMTSKLFKANEEETRFVHFVNHNFDRFRGWYGRRLSGTLDTYPVMIIFGFVVLIAVVYLGATARSELAPEEDQGIVLGQIVGPPDASAQQMLTYSEAMFNAAKDLPEYQQMFQITGTPTVNGGIGGVLFKPWDQRTRSAHELQQICSRPGQDPWGANRRLPVFAVAWKLGSAGPVRDQDHRVIYQSE